jgi:RND family efflux transporter MFP subunit
MSGTSTGPNYDSHKEGASGGTRGGTGRLVGWFFILFLVFVVLGAYMVFQRRSEHRVLAQQTERMAVPHVTVIRATTVAGESELVLPGTLNAFIESPIYARTNGYLKKWYKDIGSHVDQGDLLAEIDTPEIDQQLAQARADLATMKANLELAAITASRYQDLAKTDSVSKQDVDNANGDLAAKKAAMLSAEANVNRLEDLESFKRVFAPFSGIITHRNVDIGNLINAGNGGTSIKEMFDVAQIDPLRVYISVPQSYAPSMRPGLKACLELAEFQGRQFCGQVARTANSIDPGTRTLLTEVDVRNPTGTLLPGAYAQVHFDAKLPGQRLSLPINALLFRPEGTMAATVGPDSRINLKKLTIGRDFGDNLEILQGIALGDNVVLNPVDSLEQGEKVEAKPRDSGGLPGSQKSGSAK